MIQNPTFANAWIPIVNTLLPDKYNCDDNIKNHPKNYTKFNAENYAANLQYTANGLRGAVDSIVQEGAIKSKSDVLDSLPEGDFPVFYTYTRASEGDSTYGGMHATGYGYYIQLFYDFEIEGIQGRFETPSVNADDTAADLEKKGYSFALGGSSDSYQVTAENRNNFENTVEKSYSYEKSTSTSTTVSNTYSQNWTEETTIGVEFNVPVLAALSPHAKVEQSFSYSYGMEKTYETSAEESYSQSISDTISVPLPAHTGIKVNVDVTDIKTTIPYKGAVRIKYKTRILSVSGYQRDGSNQYHEWKDCWYNNYTFGRDGFSAVEDLDARITNRDVQGYDPDKLDMKTLYQGEFKAGADSLLAGQPVAPYFGDFHYTSKNTIITPQKVYPLYALDRLVPDKEDVTLYELQEMRLDDISIKALDEYDVDWYGFNARLSGQWTVVDEDLNDASEYAEITKNRNGYPVLKALKPSDGKVLFLRYAPNSDIQTTQNFNSELIELTINPVKLSSVTLEGSFEPIYLNDGSNTADVSGLTVTAKDEDGNDFPVTNVKWYAEESEGITVDETTGDISFSEPGTYQIYAVVNGTESNRVVLQVLPARYLAELSVTGTIPDLIYNDDTAKSFDLSSLEITAKDQYGQDMALDSSKYLWQLTSDKGYAEVKGNIITGLVVGTDTMTLYYPVGTDENQETVYKTALPVTVKVTAKPYVHELYYNGGAPAAVEGEEYDLSQIPLLARDQHGNSIAVPQDIQWKLADNNQTKAVVENGKLIVEAEQIADASNADVILEAYSALTDKTAKNVVVKAEQKPVLTTIKAVMDEDFILRLDENAVLADHFSAVAYDQYGREMQGVNFEWVSSNPAAVSLTNGTLKAESEATTEIYAKFGDIESNKINLTVNAPRRLTDITVSGVSAKVAKNTTFDLKKAVVKTFDQFKQEFSQEDLAAYPASIRWTLEKNDTNAVIDGDILSFGDKEGKMTLICAAVNADTNVIVEKRIEIQIGGSTGGSGGGGGGSAVSEYTLNFDTDGGSAVKAVKADKNSKIDLAKYVPEKAGYEFAGWYKDKELKESVTTVKLTADMTVYAKWTEKQANGKDFSDVGKDDYYHDPVQWAVKKGITTGTSDTTFEPAAICTRAQMVTFLWRTSGSPEPTSDNNPFGDVKADDYYYKAVLWALEKGITLGTSETAFSPDDTVTRGQTVAFLWRMKGKPEVSAVNNFSDVPADAYYAGAVNWAADKKITAGTTDTTFGSEEPCTRGHIVTFLYRAEN